ncbi:DUF6468 domain-containing protein [Kiloniella laminariae]|uniref:DUF6468 domain-containing protein n=1 Tax=Kiloniella laminariae TaxID=454162 RepID=A0ABT4LHB4_9PROT|nr:DUF6468 domain-containing protein [Kiloniella laminariae]MCZ4280489.1 DUF6468 domain-containing protein [Kiloniella laminariae]
MPDLTNLELGFNIIVAILLIATIGYAVVLNKKLDALRDAKAEMEILIRSFAETTAKAEKSLADLKVHASQTGTGLQEQSRKADGILSDLSYLVDRAEVVADRLEGNLGAARKQSPESLLPKGVKKNDPGESLGHKAADKLAAELEETITSHKVGAEPKKKDLSPAAEDLLKALKGMR